MTSKIKVKTYYVYLMIIYFIPPEGNKQQKIYTVYDFLDQDKDLLSIFIYYIFYIT